MSSTKKQAVRIAESRDILTLRSILREVSQTAGLSPNKQARLATAVAELARNLIDHANGGGHVFISLLEEDPLTGVEITCIDQGPGIADIGLALKKGYSTKRSLGLGLPAAKALSDKFGIESEIEKGTKINLTVWNT